jgi:hypothetical protein
MALQEGGITVTAEVGLKKHRNQRDERGKFTGHIEEYVLPPEEALVYLEDQDYLQGVVAEVERQHPGETLYAIHLEIGKYKIYITPHEPTGQEIWDGWPNTSLMI